MSKRFVLVVIALVTTGVALECIRLAARARQSGGIAEGSA
jgi:hypothetical protein